MPRLDLAGQAHGAPPGGIPAAQGPSVQRIWVPPTDRGQPLGRTGVSGGMDLRLLLLLVLTMAAPATDLTLAREQNWLVIRGDLPGGELRINYIESYCRAGSTT